MVTVEIAGTAAVLLLVARVLFGGVLAFMGLNHFLNADDMAGYAGMKGIPAPKLAVTVSGGTLIFGGLTLILGVYPVLGAGAIAAFMLVVTPTMHDFWTVEDPEQQQQEMTQFLKNVVTLGAALGFLAIGGAAWPLSVGIGL